MKSFNVRILGIMMCAFLILSGCNVFESFEPEPGESDDPEVLLKDAEAALAEGNADQAVEIYKKALTQAPNDLKVQVGYAQALFIQSDIDLGNLLDLADHLNPESSSNMALRQDFTALNGLFQAEQCTWEGGVNRTVFNPLDFPEVNDLLAFDYVMILDLSQLRELAMFVLNEVAGGRPPGTFALPAPWDAENIAQADDALFSYAVALLLSSYFDSVGTANLTWYRVDGSQGDEWIGFCAEEADYNDVIGRIEGNIESGEDAATLLETRAFLFGGDGAEEAAMAVRDAANTLAEHFVGSGG